MNHSNFMKGNQNALGKKMNNRKYHLVCNKCGEEFIGRNWNTRYCNKCKEDKLI